MSLTTNQTDVLAYLDIAAADLSAALAALDADNDPTTDIGDARALSAGSWVDLARGPGGTVRIAPGQLVQR